MAFIANDFTPSAIAASVLQEGILLESSRSNELSKEVIAGQAILQNQDPVLSEIHTGDQCTGVKVTVMRNNSLDKGGNEFDCEVGTGVFAGSESITLNKEILTNLEKFSIDDTLCSNAFSFGQLLGEMKLRAKAGLESKLSKALVTLAASGADTPDTSWFETPGSVVGDIYQVATADFKADLIADIQWAAKAANMPNAIILNGRNFYNKAVLEMYSNIGCCTNDAILNRNQFFSIYWDALNVDQVTGAASTLAIDKNAILFWSAVGYGNLGMENMIQGGNGSTFYWTETLPRLQYYANGQFNPIYVDFRATRYCVKDSVGIPRNGWNIEAGLVGSMALNLPNSDNRQGIIRIDKVA